MGYFISKPYFCCFQVDTHTPVTEGLNEINPLTVLFEAVNLHALVTALFSLQALSMGMMTEYYHYIFTTLVSMWTLANEIEML